jgi:hypothetical protein
MAAHGGLAKMITDIGGKANPYLIGAGIILGGISFFKSRRAEKRRRTRLKAQMEGDIARVEGEIPQITSEYKATADMYRASGNVVGQRIYEQGALQLQGGGQSNLAFGQENVKREVAGGLLGAKLGGIAINTAQQVAQTQNQLASELNRAQGSIDDIRASYAKEGIASDQYNLNLLNMKYV